MDKATNIGGKLFFYILIICIVSSIYFNLIPVNEYSFLFGVLINIIYFSMIFYTGYKNNLKIKEAIIVGIIGNGSGIFLIPFAMYTYFILNLKDTALWMIIPYISPTFPIVYTFIENLHFIYFFHLILINMLLVIVGAISKILVNKLSS